MTDLILAADAGGTKTNLALIPAAGPGRIGAAQAFESYPSADFPSLEALIDAFRRKHAGPIAAASIGFAGPVAGGRGRGTHVPWVADERDLARHLGIGRVHVINDLVAAGYAIPGLPPAELVSILPGRPDRDANAAVLSAGTGLGETLLVRRGGELHPVPSEGGHADFSPRTDLEVEVFLALRAEFGRVSVERVLSGIGLGNVARVLHARDGADRAMASHQAEGGSEALPATVSRNALAGTCTSCVRSLDLMVGVYGAEAANVALRGMALSGIYLGGGVPPRILPALQGPAFREAFLAKEPLRDLVERVPVWVVLNERATVLGAARFATLSLDGPRASSL